MTPEVSSIGLERSPVGILGPLSILATAEPSWARSSASRLEHVDLLKGLAIFGVVLHHVSIRPLGPDVATHISFVVKAFSWAVYAFLFLAGYLHGRNTKVISSWEFVRQRARRLLVPYLLLGVGYAGLRELARTFRGADFPSEHSRGFWSVIQCLLTVDTGGIVGQQLYFYPLLFLISCLLLTIWSVTRTQRSVAVVVAILYLTIVSFALSGIHISNTGVSRTMVLAGLFQYSLGFLFGRSEVLAGPWRAAALAMGVIGLFSLLAQGREALLVLAVPLLLTLAFQRLGAGGRFDLAPLRELGRASSVIFAYHSPFILFSQIVLMHRLHVPPYCNVTVALISTLVICWLIWWVAGRVPALRFLRV